jgi:hypothetical protein
VTVTVTALQWGNERVWLLMDEWWASESVDADVRLRRVVKRMEVGFIVAVGKVFFCVGNSKLALSEWVFVNLCEEFGI